MQKLIKGMASDFMDVEYVRSTPAQEIDPQKIEKYVPLKVARYSNSHK